MGAYGAALHAMRFSSSTLLNAQELENFYHKSQSAICRGCTNHCHLTINTFSNGKKFISGNQCPKGLGQEESIDLPNLHAWKRERLYGLQGKPGPRGKIGLPMALACMNWPRYGMVSLLRWAMR